MFNLKTAALGAAFVGSTVTMTLTAASAQALTLGVGDLLNFAGGAEFSLDPNPVDLPSTIDFFDASILDQSTTGGFFTTYVGGGMLDVTVSDIELTSYLGDDTYKAEFTNPFIIFEDGVQFVVSNPVTVERNILVPGTVGLALSANPFFGTFVDASGATIGRGVFSANQINGLDGSFSATIEVVPEPLTILGAGAAAAFGGAFKRKLGKNNKKGSTKA